MHSCVFFFKQKTAYDMRISDWSSDVCSSVLGACNTKPCARGLYPPGRYVEAPFAGLSHAFAARAPVPGTLTPSVSWNHPTARDARAMQQHELDALFDQQAAGYDTQWSRMAPIRASPPFPLDTVRSAERRRWKSCVCTFRSRLTTSHSK